MIKNILALSNYPKLNIDCFNKLIDSDKPTNFGKNAAGCYFENNSEDCDAIEEGCVQYPTIPWWANSDDYENINAFKNSDDIKFLLGDLLLSPKISPLILTSDLDNDNRDLTKIYFILFIIIVILIAFISIILLFRKK